MKIIYDMSTSQVLESQQPTQMHAQPKLLGAQLLPEAQLQAINTLPLSDPSIPPDLGLMNLDTFLATQNF